MYIVRFNYVLMILWKFIFLSPRPTMDFMSFHYFLAHSIEILFSFHFVLRNSLRTIDQSSLFTMVGWWPLNFWHIQVWIQQLVPIPIRVKWGGCDPTRSCSKEKHKTNDLYSKWRNNYQLYKPNQASRSYDTK